MTNREAIKILSELHNQCCQADSIFCTDVTGARCEAVDMAISALQAQDSKTRKICNTCKHDPPSKKWPCADCDMRNPADRWEPKDVPDTNAGGTVSRQAAIDALMDEFKRVPTTAIRAKNRIDRLPSAQPERTCVNCGRTVNNGGWYADGGTRCPIEEHYALPKDGYCHLWEKRNVTDDDYPERRANEDD